MSAFVELHIEQGPLLEREGVQIGVVTAIAAPASFRVQFNGDGGHAGALLMPDRSAFDISISLVLTVYHASAFHELRPYFHCHCLLEKALQ